MVVNVTTNFSTPVTCTASVQLGCYGHQLDTMAVYSIRNLICHCYVHIVCTCLLLLLVSFCRQ